MKTSTELENITKQVVVLEELIEGTTELLNLLLPQLDKDSPAYELTQKYKNILARAEYM